MMFFHFLTYLFLFPNAITAKYKSIKALEDYLYEKVTEAKCSGNFKLKAWYTAEEKRVCRFCENKNYCIKDVINKINGEKEMNKVFLFDAFKVCTTHYRSDTAWCPKAVIKSL